MAIIIDQVIKEAEDCDIRHPNKQILVATLLRRRVFSR
jgi:hypothetical protein